jgi:hypothetical protein
VYIFGPENVVSSRVIFVSYTISDLWPDHHIAALHVVVHHILKLWHESVSVYQIEEDLFLLDDLNSNVPLSIVC